MNRIKWIYDMKKTLFLLVSCCLALTLRAASPIKMHHVQPAFWWAGMVNPELQILLHGEGVGECEATLTAPDVKLLRAVRPANRNYLLLYVDARQAKAQRFQIVLQPKKGRAVRVPYELKPREARQRSTFDAGDVLYLLMPDRFANGDASNDVVAGLLENESDARKPDARHGGDLCGIGRHLDYLADLGVTALWLTPTLINDMPAGSYHGYAITDYYETDPRFGSNDDYRRFVDEAHSKGLKVVMDMVFNHCGSRNFLFADRPADDWFNFDSRYVQTNYKTGAVSDPHAAPSELRLAQDGWFVEPMPDLNQRNPHVLAYLIQNSIWWIEFAGIDGIRQDTYPYADMEAMARWCKAVDAEYPGFNIVGETWIGNNVGVSFWQKDSKLATPRNSALPTVMDFPLMDLLNSVCDEETNDWDKGFARLYEYLSQDLVYADPMHLLTFLTNHDTPRFARTAEQAASIWRYRQALTLLLTLRGIPQLYYGDEIGMWADKSHGDGALRQNFPGGWRGDAANAFMCEGRTELQNAYFDFTRRLLQWRKGNTALSRGTLTHYAVKDGVYVYARRAAGRTVTVVLNGTGHEVSVPLERYREVLPARQAVEVTTGTTVALQDSLVLPPHDVAALDFK